MMRQSQKSKKVLSVEAVKAEISTATLDKLQQIAAKCGVTLDELADYFLAKGLSITAPESQESAS